MSEWEIVAVFAECREANRVYSEAFNKHYSAGLPTFGTEWDKNVAAACKRCSVANEALVGLARRVAA